MMVMLMNAMRNNDQMRLSMLFFRLSDDMGALQTWSTSATTRPPASIKYAFVIVTIFTNASPKSLSERTGKAVGKWTTPHLTPTMVRAMPPSSRCI